MKKRLAAISTLVLPVSLIGAGFFVSDFPSVTAGSESEASDEAVPQEARTPDGEFVLPVKEYAERRTLKRFGTFVDDGRFYGYHLGEDVEFVEDDEEIPVLAIAAGTVLLADWVSGYGGVMVVAHDGGPTAIYGHLDPASYAARAGGRVTKGQEIARLGEGHTRDTDERRKHLHFALYQGEEFRIRGYTLDKAELDDWVDPDAFFRSNGIIPSLPE